MAKKIPFYRPHIDNKEKNQINEVLSERTSKVKELEVAFVKYIGSDYAVSSSDGTSALHLAMLAINLKRGDKVLCSVNAYPAVPEVVRHFDAEPIFVDIESKNYNIDLNKLKKSLEKNQSKKLKAIIVSHMPGKLNDLTKIYELAKQYKVKVIEDASSVMGSKYQDKYIGNSGADVTIFSFASHLCNSITNGGMMVTNNKIIYQRARLLGFHGMEHKSCDEYGNVDYIYDVIDIGWKYDISQLHAAYCLADFEKLEEDIERRVEIAKEYDTLLANLKHVKLPQRDENDVCFIYIVEIDKNRDHFVNELKKEGIKVSVQYMPLHLTKYYKSKYSMKVFDYSVALGCFQRVMSLPIYSSMSDSEVIRVAEAIKKVAQAHI